MFSSFVGDEWHFLVTIHLLSYHIYEVESNVTLGIKYVGRVLIVQVMRMLHVLCCREWSLGLPSCIGETCMMWQDDLLVVNN
jgi:branched-subunit amino acid transport protein AzlD